VDAINYRNNLQSFIDNIKNAFVERISFHIDTDPTFNKKAIPFEFLYCYSLRITTDKEHFDIMTSMTDSAVETFWILHLEKVNDFSKHLLVNSKVKNAEFKTGHNDLAFRIKIEFEKSILYFYSAEIYDEEEGLDYRINDEMILVIENEKDAETFETIIIEHKILAERQKDSC